MGKTLILKRLQGLKASRKGSSDGASSAVLRCIWTDTELLVLPNGDQPLVRGLADPLLRQWGRQQPAFHRLEVHYQGSDLLILPPLPPGQSRMSWLQRHLPSGRSLTDYVLAATSTSANDSVTAMLPRSRVSGLFAQALAAGFAETEIVAFPGDLQESVSLQLANGLWRIDPKRPGQIHAVPLPSACEGTPPPWLKPQGPVVDMTEAPFTKPVFRWTDVLAQQRKTQMKNRKFLLAAAALLVLGFGLAWLGMGWLIQRAEQALVSLSLQQKHQVSALQNYDERRTHLESLYQHMQAHPFSKRSQTHATSVRNWLNAFPEPLLLNQLRYLQEDGQGVCFLEGFSTDGLGPMTLIRNLEGILPQASIDLVQMSQLPEKQRKTDPRLANHPQWLQFTIRMGDL